MVQVTNLIPESDNPTRRDWGDHFALLVVQCSLQASVSMAFSSDRLPGWMYVTRDFLNFPILYSFCYGYLYAADPAALFGELVGGAGGNLDARGNARVVGRREQTRGC